VIKIIIISLMVCSVSCGPAYHDVDNGDWIQVTPKYKSISGTIFAAKCVLCHGGKKKEKNIDLTSYEKIFSRDIFPPLVIPGNPEKSSLYQSVATGRMPKGGPGLTRKELRVIYEWIKGGGKKEDEDIPPTNPGEPGGTEPGGNEPGAGGGTCKGEPGCGKPRQ